MARTCSPRRQIQRMPFGACIAVVDDANLRIRLDRFAQFLPQIGVTYGSRDAAPCGCSAGTRRQWQDRALGRRLLVTLLEHAQTARVREAVSVVLATNRAMLRLARSMGLAVTAEPGDATVVRIRRDLRILNAQPH